jgi:hypothetical protein
MPPMSKRLLALSLSISAVLAACNADTHSAPAAPGAVSQTAAPAATDPAKEAVMPTLMSEDINQLVPAGMTLVDSVRGDLTGQGHADALLVAAPPTAPETELGQGSPRSVLLLRNDGNGKLQVAARNDRLVPCERCGGIAGDPYAYSRIDGGKFTVSVSGGSRQRWASDYHFQYQPQDNSWQLVSVTREITDTVTGQNQRQQLEADALDGALSFADFDPAGLPAAPELEDDLN